MKKIIKSTFVPLVLSSICGFASARLIFNIYEEDLSERFTSSKIYLLQNGTYNSYEEMRKNNLGNSYIYYEDDTKYKSVIGITQEEDNIDKIKKIYDQELVVEEYYIGPALINNKQNDYDKQLLNTSDPKEIQTVINNIIELYKDDEAIKLILAK